MEGAAFVSSCVYCVLCQFALAFLLFVILKIEIKMNQIYRAERISTNEKKPKTTVFCQQFDVANGK